MSIEKITQTISDYPAVAERLDEAFYEDMEAWVMHGANITKNEQNTLKEQINTVIDGINVSINDMNILKNQAESVTTTASNSAAVATQKASESSTSANQALTYKNQIEGYVIPAGASYGVEQINTQNSAMTKAQFNALAEERKANRAGSGFDSFGKHFYNYSTRPNVNDGIVTDPLASNFFHLGWNDANAAGISKTPYPILHTNGANLIINKVNNIATNIPNTLLLPTAPNIYPHDTVLTTEQINSGVIKHADASNSGLIVNGKFDTDTSGWAGTFGDATITLDANRMKVTALGSDRGVYQGIPCVIGKSYTVEFYAKATDQYAKLAVASTSTNYGTPVLTTYVTNGSATMYRYTGTFVATATTMYIRFYMGTANQSITVDNISVFPVDAISRSDLVFLESWHEDISEKNIVYPLGNTQYLGGNTDGLTGIANGAFTGFETYSLFSNWQAPSALIGKGYAWSNLTEAQKKSFISNADNNCYLDGDKVIQVRYRVRVVMGQGDAWYNVNTQTPNPLSYREGTPKLRVNVRGKSVSVSDFLVGNNILYQGGLDTEYANNKDVLSGVFKSSNSSAYGYTNECYAIPLALIHRRNQGVYHPTYNSNGSKVASDGLPWYSTAVNFTSTIDCFDPAKLLTESGYIGTISGRPDGLFYDQIHEGDIQDLRNSSKKVEDYNRLISREFNNLVAGITRGQEEEWQTESFIAINTQLTNLIQIKNNTGFKLYDNVVLHDSGNNNVYQGYITNIGISVVTVNFTYTRTAGNTYTYIKRTTRTKSNTLLHCDIIGNPSNYPIAWKETGVFGTPLIVAEDGTSLLPNGILDTFKLSRKANATSLLCLRSTDNGATWTSFTPTFNTTLNTLTLTDEPAGNLVMVYYQTHTSMAVPVVNSEVLELGLPIAISTRSDVGLAGTLISKVLTYEPSPSTLSKVSSSFTVLPPVNSLQRMLGSGFYGINPTHNNFPITPTNTPTVKVFPYLTRKNGKAYLNLVFKEMKHNGTSWGDNNQFNIVDNISATTDNNAQTVLIGQKTVELPYFIGDDE